MWRTLVACASLFIGGCSFLGLGVKSLPDDLKYAVYHSEPIMACVARPGGVCVPNPKFDAIKEALAAERRARADLLERMKHQQPGAKVLVSDTTKKLERFFNRAAGINLSDDPPVISRQEFVDYSRAIHEVTSMDGWATLRRQIEADHAVALARHDDAGKAAASAIGQISLVELYLEAYFNTAKGGFISRGGANYTFPGVSLTVDPTAAHPIQVSKIDFSQVGADVVRVFIEALADEWGQLPAAASSTACLAKNDKKLDQYKELRCYGAAKEQVSSDGFTQVNNIANRVETYAATATGQFVRGASWVSLNNEAVAKLVETAIGVISRKAAEKVSWCYLACTAVSVQPQPVILQVPLKLAP